MMVGKKKNDDGDWKKLVLKVKNTEFTPGTKKTKQKN